MKTWCGPSKIVAPIMEKLAAEYEGKARLVKLDADNRPNTADAFGVMSIRNLVVLKNGKPIERTVGATTLDHCRKITETVL